MPVRDARDAYEKGLDSAGAVRAQVENDALIALAARAHGATVVTANREDLEILGRNLGVRVLGA